MILQGDFFNDSDIVNVYITDKSTFSFLIKLRGEPNDVPVSFDTPLERDEVFNEVVNRLDVRQRRITASLQSSDDISEWTDPNSGSWFSTFR